MRMRSLLLLSIVTAGCFAEGPEGQDPTGDDDTTSATDASMTATASASTTTVDPVTTTPTSDATGTTDPTDTMTTDGPTSDVTTEPTSSTGTTDPDTSSTGEPAEEVFQDFTTDPCGPQIDWLNDIDAEISCPSTDESKLAPNGFVFPPTNVMPVTIEATDEVFDEGAIVMHPPYVAEAFMFGRFPPEIYMAGDVFRARVWCVQESICSATVMLGSSLKESDPAVVGSWAVTFEDVEGVEIELDLEEAGVPIGLAVGLSLMVGSGASSGSDSILWENPRVVRP